MVQKFINCGDPYPLQFISLYEIFGGDIFMDIFKKNIFKFKK